MIIKTEITVQNEAKVPDFITGSTKILTNKTSGKRGVYQHGNDPQNRGKVTHTGLLKKKRVKVSERKNVPKHWQKIQPF